MYIRGDTGQDQEVPIDQHLYNTCTAVELGPFFTPALALDIELGVCSVLLGSYITTDSHRS